MKRGDRVTVLGRGAGTLTKPFGGDNGYLRGWWVLFDDPEFNTDIHQGNPVRRINIRSPTLTEFEKKVRAYIDDELYPV